MSCAKPTLSSAVPKEWMLCLQQSWAHDACYVSKRAREHNKSLCIMMSWSSCDFICQDCSNKVRLGCVTWSCTTALAFSATLPTCSQAVPKRGDIMLLANILSIVAIALTMSFYSVVDACILRSTFHVCIHVFTRARCHVAAPRIWVTSRPRLISFCSCRPMAACIASTA